MMVRVCPGKGCGGRWGGSVLVYCNTCHAVNKVTFIVLFGLHFQNRTKKQQVYLVMFQVAYNSLKT